jgi:toxin CptA
MSIAVSAVVGPSRVLRALLAAYGLANLAAGFAVGFAMPGRFKLAQLSAIFFCIAGALLLRCRSAVTKTRRLDISGLGQIRLTVQQDIRTGSATAGILADGAPGNCAAAEGVPVVLSGGSTVWPRLMLLRLRDDSGALTLLPVLPDSVAPGVFRALAVAAGAIGGRNNRLQEQHKIL